MTAMRVTVDVLDRHLRQQDRRFVLLHACDGVGVQEFAIHYHH